MTLDDHLGLAAQAIASAEALLIGAGAGMGVDSGLPDFRGTEGFWKAYPPIAKLGLHFAEMANPRWFREDPALAWGFYGHRMNLYRAAQPHPGFHILLDWAQRMARGAFVFTSNVDEQFQRAGFTDDRIVECHGSVGWAQCTEACGVGIYPAKRYQVTVDELTMRAEGLLPRCPNCRALARPNILMFDDGDWEAERTEAQERRFHLWLRTLGDARLTIVECGAGQAVPTVRYWMERIARSYNGTLIRINPREADVPRGHIGLPVGALAGLRAIEQLLAGDQGE